MKRQVYNLSQKPIFLLKAKLIYFILGLKFERKQYNQIVENQINKGFKKYNKTILECPVKDYNWGIMAIEEIIDALYYAKKKEQITRQTIKEEKVFSYYDIETLFKEWTKEKNGPGLFYKRLHDEIELEFKSDKHFK